MFAGFKLELGTSGQDFLKRNVKKPNVAAMPPSVNDAIKIALEKYVLPDGSLDATVMLKTWFPNIACDVFISHSHKDRDLANLLAVWLREKFGITSFIDSTMWGFCDDLLKKIDQNYCYNKDKNTYSYEKRNISTAHVHILLTAAITMMMDRTECLFFLNTPNSVSPGQSISTENKEITYSPWIYAELSFSQWLRRKSKPDHRPRSVKKVLDSTASINESLSVTYLAPQEHLVPIDHNDLLAWGSQQHGDRYEALDNLYSKYKQKIDG